MEEVFKTIDFALFKEGVPKDFAVRGLKYGFEVLELEMAADLLKEMQVAQAVGMFASGSRFFVISAYSLSMRAA